MVVDGAQVKYEVTFNGEDEAVIVGGAKCDFTYTESTKNGIHSHANACVCGNNTTKTYSDEETFVETVAPTCTAKGYDSYACKDCGAKWTKNEVKENGHTPADKATSNGNGTHSVCCTVEGCGYKISTEKCSGGQATCSAAAKCEVCGGEYGEATGEHVLADNGWTVVSEATCYAPKKLSQVCSECGETIEKDEGTALDHKMTEFGYVVPDELVEILAEEGIEIKAPTCGARGLSLSYCENCITHYETNEEKMKDDAHVWEIIGSEGDCSTGLYDIKECIYCGTTIREANEDVDHEWLITTDVPATCTKPGFREYTCKNCGSVDEHYYDEFEHDKLGEAYEDAYLAPDGVSHTYKYVGIAEATCTEPAKSVEKCVDCGVLKETVVEGSEALGHAPVYYKGAEADCRIEGTVAHYTCKNCKVMYADEACTQVLETVVIPRTDHEDKDGNGKCDECNAAVYRDDSSKFCGCICHKENFLMRIIYNIVNFFWKLFKISKTCDCGAVHWN